MRNVFLLGLKISALHFALGDVGTPHICLPAPSQKCFTLIVDEKLNWIDAEKYCERNLLNGRLASLHNAFEQAAISGWLSFLATDPWIGAIQLGSLPYRWVDNTPLDYTNWAPGQPMKSCGQVCHSTDTNPGAQCLQGKWGTADCDTTVSQFICEYGNYTSSSTTTSSPSTTASPTTTTHQMLTATDCLDWHRYDNSLPSGIYKLSPPGIAPFQAYCDMETDGGGWTVFQRRIDGSLSFYDRTWNEYKNGFNNGLDKNQWLGNEKIHILSTKDSNVDLRIDLWGDRSGNSGLSNGYWWLKQSSFYLDSEANYYILNLSYQLTGNASASGDPEHGINFNIGRPFSTIDNSHDDCNGCCTQAPYQSGGWWLSSCTYSTLNGKYVPSSWGEGFEWWTSEYYINPAQSRMMLRRTA